MVQILSTESYQVQSTQSNQSSGYYLEKHILTDWQLNDYFNIGLRCPDLLYAELDPPALNKVGGLSFQNFPKKWGFRFFPEMGKFWQNREYSNKGGIIYFHTNSNSSNVIFVFVWCLCYMLIYIISISVLCVSQEGLCIIASNQQIYNFCK